MTKNKPVIRPLQTADLSAVFAIERTRLLPWTFAMLKACLMANDGNWLIEEAGQIIGFAILRIVGEQAELLNIVIAPAKQRCGYAQQLLTHVIAVARAQHAAELLLEVRASNLAAQQLYEKFNFKKVGERANYYPLASGHEHAWLFTLSL